MRLQENVGVKVAGDFRAVFALRSHFTVAVVQGWHGQTLDP